MARPPPGDRELARPRRAIAARLLVGLLLLGAAAGAVAWQLGWLHRFPAKVPAARVEQALPPPPLAAGTPAPPPDASASAAPLATLPPPAASAPPDAAAAAATTPPAAVAAPAVEQALLEPSPGGPLPIIASDGREPWRVYARPFDSGDTRPRIAIVVFGVGLSAATTETSIRDLPGAVTLAFEPAARQLPDRVAEARAAGHEILLTVPMEPADYPRQDPGPYTLLTSVDAKENVRRLDWVLSRATGYVGVASINGARFAASRADLLPVLEEVRRRGLMYVDGRSTEQDAAASPSQPMALPHVVSDGRLDADAAGEAIDRRLAELEDVARRRGTALGVGYASPVTVAHVAAWAGTLEQKGLVLAPASALGAMPGPAQ